MREFNRRKFLQTVSSGAVVASSTGIASASAGGGPDDRPSVEKVTGSKANELRAEALGSDEFRALADHAREEYGARLRVPDASVYTVEGERRYGVEIPLDVGDDVVESVIGVFIEDGSVVDAVGSKADVADGRITEYTQFSVGPDGTVETESVSVATAEERSDVLSGDDPSIQADDCTLCIEALKRICPYGCGISSAVLCALVGSVNFPGGLGCAVFFAIYCFEIAESGACWYRDGPREDCELMDFC